MKLNCTRCRASLRGSAGRNSCLFLTRPSFWSQVKSIFLGQSVGHGHGKKCIMSCDHFSWTRPSFWSQVRNIFLCISFSVLLLRKWISFYFRKILFSWNILSFCLDKSSHFFLAVQIVLKLILLGYCSHTLFGGNTSPLVNVKMSCPNFD